MGHEIVYCVSCATRIPGVDFERGKAFRAGGKVVCAACLPTLSAEEQKEASLSSSRIQAAKAVPSALGSSSKLSVPRPEAPAPPAATPWRAVVAAAVVLGVVGLIGALKRNAAPAVLVERPPIAKPAPSEPSEKPEDPRLAEALAAIRKAKATRTDDLDGSVAAWEEAVRKAALTPLSADASAGLQEALRRKAAATPAPPIPEVARPPVPPPVEPPKSVPASAELQAFQGRWEAAMAKASARDFDGAIADLGRAAAELKDEDLQKAARADADDLKLARTLLAQAQDQLSRLPRGQAVSLAYRGEAGDRLHADGVVVRAGAGRVEIRQGDGSLFVEAEDATAASLAPLLGDRGEADRRALAILCVLEGDRESAGRFSALAPRFLGYAATATPPKPAPREVEARRRFYAAEREFASLETLGAAVLKYKSLLADSADTRVVRSELARIRKRADAGKDYVVLVGALRGTGTFRPTPAPRTDAAWVSRADVEGGSSAENYVEAEFAALPDATYRCWALVGGCCAETFTFYLQATDGSDVDPKTKKRAPIDPGAPLASLVKHSISGLKKTHEEHKIKGAKTHPKTPARWEWVSVPLPRFPAPGVKKVRLLSDQQGFGVAAIVVSATRSSVIPDAELKEEVARTRSAALAGQEGLAGWWRFDEGTGTAVFDAIDGGHAGVLRGKAKWTSGKVGGAVKFDAGDEVWIPGSYTFQTVTVCAWVKHDAFPDRIQRYVTLGSETAVIRYEVDKLHFYVRRDGDLRQVHGPSLEAGKWVHVAGTWDGTTARLYKDGVLVGSQVLGGTLSSDVAHILVSFANESMAGSIDDVRVYRRALGDAEIRKLCEEATPGGVVEVPAAPGGKPWRPLFDGKTAQCIRTPNRSWVFDSGALQYVPGTDDAAQTAEEFGDGEVKVRFEARGLTRLWFAFRQGPAGGYGIELDGLLSSLEAKPHELIITGKGDRVTAVLDGKPVPVGVGGVSASGCLQFGAAGKLCRILSLETR